MDKEILSLSHPLVKHCVKLRQERSYRKKCQRVVVSGLKLLSTLAPTHRFSTLFVEKGAAIPFSVRADQTMCVSSEVLKKITGVQHPEPCAAELCSPESQNVSSSQFLLVLNGVSDPGNLGTLLRSALALGWDGVFITENSVDPCNDKALRAAKGATFYLPWVQGSSAQLQEILQLRHLFAADARGQDLQAAHFAPPLALVLGNESHGVEEELKTLCTLVAIPMHKNVESLNVASAGAILLHHMRRA